MTGATRFARIHFTHGYRLSVGTGRNDLVVAVAALIATSHMNFMTEQHRFNIFFRREIVLDRFKYGVALLAIAAHVERILAVMTETAGTPPFHVAHGVAMVNLLRQERLVVTVIATIEAGMELMAEKRPGIPEPDLLNRMTLVTGCFHGESRLIVMAGATGVAALHLRHGKSFGVLAEREDAVVTIHAFIDPGMELVAEEDGTGLLHLKTDLFCGLVTAAAIPFHGKGKIRIMAGST